MTVAGIDGQSAYNARICGSTESTIDARIARSYLGGTLDTKPVAPCSSQPRASRAIALIAIP